MLIVGAKEEEEGKVSVRSRYLGDEGMKDLGEFLTSIKEEIKNAIDTIDFNRYPDPLAEKVVTAFADYYGINPKYVTAGNGSDELIFLIEAAFIGKRGQDALRCSRFFNVQILFINL